MADKDEVCTYVASFPTQVDCSENDQIFGSQIEPSHCTDTNSVIHQKIKSAFSKVDCPHLDGLIQFWAPVETDCRRILSTSDQPFSLEYLDSCFHKYRLCCIKYQYSIDDVEDDPIVITAATAFRNHLPLVVYFKGMSNNNPLIRSATKYQLTSLFLPVFYSSQTCVGVVECSLMQGFGLLVIFNKLKTALESVGLTTFHAQDCRSRSYKNICGLENTRDVIEEALEIVCESHHLTLAQVWITCLDDTQTIPKFAVKLGGYCANSDDDDILKDYYDSCDMLPLIIGEGLSGKTLQTYEPRFCRNINELSDKGLLALLPTNIEASCLVICMRTGDVDYAFEFLWTKNRNYLILLESLLLTLKRCLPSFKLASGAELGDELRVIDADNSTGSGLGFLELNRRLSQLPKASEERRKLLVAEDCMSSSQVKYKTNPVPVHQKEHGRFMNKTTVSSKRTRDVSANSELQEPDSVKRKLSNVCDTEIESNQEDNNADQEDSASTNIVKLKSSDCIRVLENTNHSASNSNSSVRYPEDNEVIIRAEYGDQQTLSYLPDSSTFADIMKNIDEAYNLPPDSYTLHFLDDEDEWMILIDEQDWENCLIHWTITGTQTIQLLVQHPPRRRYSKIPYDRNMYV